MIETKLIIRLIWKHKTTTQNVNENKKDYFSTVFPGCGSRTLSNSGATVYALGTYMTHNP